MNPTSCIRAHEYTNFCPFSEAVQVNLTFQVISSQIDCSGFQISGIVGCRL